MTPAPLVLVIAVDGSEASLRAVRHALRLAAEAPCELHLCNVQPALTYAETLLAEQSRLVDHWSGSPGHRMLAQATQAIEGAGRSAYVEVLHGDPAEQIARQAREVRADMILVGTRGHNAAAQVLLGSVARRITENAHCAVTVLR